MSLTDILVNLSDTTGIIGSAVFDFESQCHAHNLTGEYRPFVIGDIIKKIRDVADLTVSLNNEEAIHSMAIQFENGWLFLRSDGEIIVVVLADKNVNLSVANVKINAASLKLFRETSHGTNIPVENTSYDPKMTYTRPETGVRQFPAMGPAGKSAASEKSADDRSDIVGPEFMANLTEVCRDFFGPQANFVINEELRKLRTSPVMLRRAQVGSLLGGITNRISHPAGKQEFMALALGDKKREP